MFIKGFAKTAIEGAKRAIAKLPAMTKGLLNKAPSIDPVLKRVGSTKGGYMNIGTPPAVGKSGRLVDYSKYR
jgi:hypothetical protein